jgi:hypothetical protein
VVINSTLLWLWSAHCCGYEQHTVVVMNSTLSWLWTAHPVALNSLQYKTPLHMTICYSECATSNLDTFWTGNMETISVPFWTLCWCSWVCYIRRSPNVIFMTDEWSLHGKIMQQCCHVRLCLWSSLNKNMTSNINSAHVTGSLIGTLCFLCQYTIRG